MCLIVEFPGLSDDISCVWVVSFSSEETGNHKKVQQEDTFFLGSQENMVKIHNWFKCACLNLC